LYIVVKNIVVLLVLFTGIQAVNSI